MMMVSYWIPSFPDPVHYKVYILIKAIKEKSYWQSVQLISQRWNKLNKPTSWQLPSANTILCHFMSPVVRSFWAHHNCPLSAVAPPAKPGSALRGTQNFGDFLIWAMAVLPLKSTFRAYISSVPWLSVGKCSYNRCFSVKVAGPENHPLNSLNF